MKKIFYSILLSGMMVLSACDALDLSPEDYYGSNDFLESEISGRNVYDWYSCRFKR